MRARAFWVLAVACFGCSAPVNRGPVVPDRRLETGGATMVWLRASSVTDTSGNTAYLGDAPVKAEWLGGGRLRVHPKEGGVIEATLEQNSTLLYDPKVGVGLFVQADSSLFAAVDFSRSDEDLPAPRSEAGAERIGLARRGTFLRITELQKDWVRVGLPSWHTQAWISRAALGLEEHPLAPTLQTGRPQLAGGRVLRRGFAHLGAPGKSLLFAKTSCVEAQVTGGTKELPHIFQEEDGVEIAGEMKDPGDPCDARVLALPGWPLTFPSAGAAPSTSPAPVPPGYVLVQDSARARDPLTPLFEKKAKVYWLSVWHDEASCIEWTLERSQEHGRLVQRDKDVYPDGVDLVETDFGLRYSPSDIPGAAQLALTGPHTSVTRLWGKGPHSGGMGFACGMILTAVGASESTITLVQGQFPSGVRAYHKDDAFSWYLSKPACEAARASLESSTDQLALASGVHPGC